MTVAVIDTGYRLHAGMTGRFLAGYDMISDPAIANDGDGRDPDASDPGDWMSTAAMPIRRLRKLHGREQFMARNRLSLASSPRTRTTGSGLAGIDWNAKILPVRVLGKCGGYDSDIVDGIAWAAGLAVPGVPVNPTRRRSST